MALPALAHAAAPDGASELLGTNGLRPSGTGPHYCHVRTGLFAKHRVLLAGLAVLGCTSRSTTASTSTAAAGTPAVRPGLDQFVANPPEWARGKRIGLITNVAGIDSRGRNNIDLLAGDSRLRLTALFAFEHGLRGDAPAGQPIASGTDPKTGLPVYSLYGEVREPTPEMLRDIDVLMYDVQDVGARPYTRVSTMALSMKAAAAKGIPIAVLDRPNPIGGA